MPRKLTLDDVAQRYEAAVNGPLYQALLDRNLEPTIALALAVVFADAVESEPNGSESLPRTTDRTEDG